MTTDSALVFYDGTCGLCQSSVAFIIRHDRRARFHFAALQSPEGQKALAAWSALSKKGIAADSLILFEKGAYYIESEAALRIAARLDGGWKALRFLRILPIALRDAGYRWVARNRKSWFKGQTDCNLSARETNARFLS